MPLASTDAELAHQLLTKQSLQTLTLLLPVSPALAALSQQGGSVWGGENSLLPFLTAQDILYTLHILRC